MKIITLSISEINVGTRRREDFGDIEGLAASISKYGLFHPVIVDGNNNLVAGERRLVACTSLGWSEIPCRLYSELSDDERLEIELEENLQRKDLTPFEQSKNLVHLAQVAENIIKSEFRSTADQKSDAAKTGRPAQPVSERKVAERIGVPRSTIHNAKQHVKAVQNNPELKDSSQREAIETLRPKVSPIRKPIPKPSLPKATRSSVRPLQENILEIKHKGGLVYLAKGLNQTEQFNLLSELTFCRDEIGKWADELTDSLNDMRAEAV